MRRVVIGYCIVVIILIHISSCATNTDEKGVLSIIESSKNCSNPCWKGITPGITSKQDAIIILQKMGLIFSRENNSEDYSSITYEKNEYDLFFIRLDNNIVKFIEFINYEEISVNMIIMKIGEPRNTTCVYPAADWYYLSLLYPDRGLNIDVKVDNKEGNYRINEESIIFSATLRNIKTVDELINDFRENAPNNIAIRTAPNLLISWHGYGTYSPCVFKPPNPRLEPTPAS